MNDLNLSLKQFYPVPGRLSENGRVILETIQAETAKGADLICFPECSLTGYTVDCASEVSIAADDPHLDRIREAAFRNHVTVSFGFIEKKDGKRYLSHMVTGPDGTMVYRKTHLGSREKYVFTAGDSLPVYRTKDHRFGVCLCWESHIPEIAACYRRQGAQLLLVPYASGMSGERCRELWSRHLPARASDNGIFVAACNGLRTREGDYCGGLAVYDPKGQELTGYFEKGETVIPCRIGGRLPREREEDMHHISYFDHRRPELYAPILKD